MMPWYLGNGRLNMEHWWGISLGFLALWSVMWTGLALWHSAQRKEKGWFIFFFLVHTAGIIEFFYLLLVAKIFSSSTKSPPRRRK